MRLRFNFRDGQTSAPIDDVTEFIPSDQFEDFPAVTDPDHISIILDPIKEYGEPEVVWIIEHADGSDTVEVLRAQDDTVSRAHPQVLWAHGVLASDFEELTGPQGPQGPEGPAAENFTHIHEQEVPNDVWDIAHGLTGFPNVTVVDSAQSTVEGNIVYIDNNNVRIYFSGNFAGKAYLS